MAIGLSYEDYWCGPPELAADTRKAHKIKMTMDNQVAWWNGQYLMSAIGAVLGGKKGAKYPEEPYSLPHEKAEKLERERQKAIAFFNSFRDGYKNRNS